MQFAKSALTTAAAAAFATTFAIAPAFAQPEAPASSERQDVQSAGASQHAELGSPGVAGVPPLVLGLGGAALIFTGAVIASDDSSNSTTGTR